MSLYFTDTTTGELIPLDLSRLAYPPKKTRHNRPVKRRNYYRRPEPLKDFAIGVGGVLVAGIILYVGMVH